MLRVCCDERKHVLYVSNMHVTYMCFHCLLTIRPKCNTRLHNGPALQYGCMHAIPINDYCMHPGVYLDAHVHPRKTNTYLMVVNIDGRV